MANRKKGHTILHALFEIGLGEHILDGVVPMDLVRELFDIYKNRGAKLNDSNRKGRRFYQLIADGNWRVQVQVLGILMEYNVVDKDDMMAIVQSLRTPELLKLLGCGDV
jgi:hypothetical protein